MRVILSLPDNDSRAGYLFSFVYLSFYLNIPPIMTNILSCRERAWYTWIRLMGEFQHVSFFSGVDGV